MDFFWDSLFWPAFFAVAAYVWKTWTSARAHTTEVARKRRAEKREVVRKYLTTLEQLLNHHHEASAKDEAARILDVKAQLNEIYLRSQPDTAKKMTDCLRLWSNTQTGKTICAAANKVLQRTGKTSCAGR